jgi:GTP-binding protein HflX
VPEDQLDEMMAAVGEVLDEIGAGDRPQLLVLNKADLLDDDERGLVAGRHRDAVLVSARTGDGLDRLRERIERSFRETLEPVELLVPFDRGAVLSELHEIAGDLEREDTAAGVRVKARVPAALAARLAPFSVNGRSPNGRGEDA